MKKVLILFLWIISYSAFADAGYAYRFRAQIMLKNSDTVSGYIYSYNYEKFDIQNYGRDIINYFSESYPPKSVEIFPYIATYQLGAMDIDFALAKSKQLVEFEDISGIYYIDVLEFSVGQRLVELEPKEMDFLKNHQPVVRTVYNENYSVSQSFVLVSWKYDANLDEIQNNISGKLIEVIPENEPLIESTIKPFFDYLDELKLELLNMEILIFGLWGAC